MPALIPLVIGSALLVEGVEAATNPELGTVFLDESKVQNTTADLTERVQIVLGEKTGSFVHKVPFQSESNVGGATVAGRNASIVSCSPAAVWMLLDATGKIPSSSTFADFIVQASKGRDPQWGWTHQGFEKTAQEYGIALEVNDYGDREKFTKDEAWAQLTQDLARSPVGLSIRQIDPITKLAESKNTHMIVLRGAESDGKGSVTFFVNDPIAKSETTARNSTGAQARDHRLGVTSWPSEFVKESSLDRWLVVAE